MSGQRPTCETCGVILKRRTHAQLVDVLTQLHIELTTRPVTIGCIVYEDSYRNGRATELITMIKREETARFCPRHSGS